MNNIKKQEAVPNNHSENIFEATQDENEKLHWYQNEAIWTASRHVEKDMKEVDPPECTCLQGIAQDLLKLGGECVDIYRKESAFLNFHFIATGKPMTCERLKLRIGTSNHCHENVSQLWLKYPKKYRIVSGFALAEEEQTWTAHSWLLDDKDYIIETTGARSMYCGTVMDDKVALSFAQSMLAGRRK